MANLARPALLIGFLAASRRAEAPPDSEAGTVGFERWRAPLLQASAPVTITIATAYGAGFAVGQPLLVTLTGVIASFAIVASVLMRSPWHGQKKGQGASGTA